jgi:hypothetical protein
MSTNNDFHLENPARELIQKSLSQHKIGTMFPGIADAYRSGMRKE